MLKIDCDSDSDDNVDVNDSSGRSSKRASKTKPAISKMPNKGVVNMARLEKPSISPRPLNPNKRGKSTSRKRYMDR